MAVLRSTGGVPMASAGGSPLAPSPPNLAAPPLVSGPDALLFSMGKDRPGVPGVNDQFELFGVDRSWDATWTHPEGFCGVRWQPTWMRADGYYGSWEPAEGEIFRLRRKGASGADARTLEITCGPNPAPIPVGDAVVLWQVGDHDGAVVRSASVSIGGWSLPLRQKLTVSRCVPSAAWDPNGRRIVEVVFPQDLPAIDHAPPNLGWGQMMRLRHWSFYADAATHRMRWPLPWFADNTRDLVLPNGGYVLLGGLQMRPTWRCWTRDYNEFGASLVEELWRKECEGLAWHFGDTDPRRLMVELENEPVWGWDDWEGEPGYGRLLAEVWYPVAREVWGMERTIGVKSTSFGSIDSLRDDFRWTNPVGHNTLLFAHNYDGQFHLGPGGRLAIWADIGESDYAAEIIASRIRTYGFKGGGMSEAGTHQREWWDYSIVPEAERGRRLGRILTSMTNRGLDTWVWGHVGDMYNCVAIYDMGGKRIESYWPAIRPYAIRAGRTTT